jgi:hypothetical protein
MISMTTYYEIPLGITTSIKQLTKQVSHASPSPSGVRVSVKKRQPQLTGNITILLAQVITQPGMYNLSRE